MLPLYEHTGGRWGVGEGSPAGSFVVVFFFLGVAWSRRSTLLEPAGHHLIAINITIYSYAVVSDSELQDTSMIRSKVLTGDRDPHHRNIHKAGDYKVGAKELTVAPTNPVLHYCLGCCI